MDERKLLRNALSGNLTSIPLLINANHEKLLEASRYFSELLLTKQAVLKVLYCLKNRTINPSIIQSWASFMRCGFTLTEDKKPITPLEINYKLDEEDSIVEVLSRLDELGDIIDGTIDDNEIDQLIELLMREE